MLTSQVLNRWFLVGILLQACLFYNCTVLSQSHPLIAQPVLNSPEQHANHPEGSCLRSHTCVDGDDIALVAHKNESFYLSRSCYCDFECQTYSDCCPDKANSIEAETNTQTSTKLSSLMPKPSTVSQRRRFRCFLERKVCPTEKINNYIYSIGDCPRDYADKEIVDKCNRSNHLERLSELTTETMNGQETFLQWPFYSNHTELTYNNLYCAICNGESSFYLQPWNAAFRCNQNVSKGLSQKRTNASSPSVSQSSSFINDERDRMSEIRTQCVFVKWMSFYMKYRYCRHDLISTCQRSTGNRFVDDILAHKCANGEYRVRTATNEQTGAVMLFRNHHCAQCSGVKLDEMICARAPRIPDSKYRCSFVDVTWSMIFDFNFFTGEYRVGFNKQRNEIATSRCETGSFYDPFEKKCRPVTLKASYFKPISECDNTIRAHSQNEFKFVGGGGSSSSNSSVLLIYDNLLLNSSYYKYSADNQTLFTCSPDQRLMMLAGDTYNVSSPIYERKFSRLHNILTIVGISLSLVALVLLMLVYLTFSSLRNRPGKNLMCLAISYILVYLIIIISTIVVTKVKRSSSSRISSSSYGISNETFIDDNQMIIGSDDSRLEPAGTQYDWLFYVLAVLLNYAFMCAFSWMTIISYDICRTFVTISGLISTAAAASVKNGKNKNEERKLFALNLLFGFVFLPMLPLGAALFVDNVYPSSTYAPRYGGRGESFRIVWISNRRGLLVFYIIPVSIMLIVNFIFFICTVLSIIRTDSSTANTIKRSTTSGQQISKTSSTSMLTKNESKGSKLVSAINKMENANSATSTRFRIILFVKLLILMGLSWLLAFMASIINQNWVYLLNTLVNAFQGFLIAASFTLNRKVYNLIKKKLEKCMISEFLATTRSTKTDSSPPMKNKNSDE
jgi:hypothetical protein